jgi:hypothetical protein
MLSIARFKNVKVEIQDQYECGGILYATIKACEGEPFVGGDKWPIKTAYTICQVDEFQTVGTAPDQVQPDNLLNLALQYISKRQWYSGEVVRIWTDHTRYAFLKEEGGFVRLNVSGYQPSCLIFWLSVEGWQVSEEVNESYYKWARKAQEMIK